MILLDGGTRRFTRTYKMTKSNWVKGHAKKLSTIKEDARALTTPLRRPNNPHFKFGEEWSAFEEGVKLGGFKG